MTRRKRSLSCGQSPSARGRERTRDTPDDSRPSEHGGGSAGGRRRWRPSWMRLLGVAALRLRWRGRLEEHAAPTYGLLLTLTAEGREQMSRQPECIECA
jgi:hypothetical protein